MSFWEDRFVNRPHASAVPDHLQTDVHGWDSADTSEPVVGRAWSIVSEPAEVAHDEPVETELSEIEAVEYKRHGMFRRRRPVPIASEISEVGVEPAASEHENGEAHVFGNGRPWAIVESSYEVEPPIEVELEEIATESADEAALEDEPAAPVEYRRRGLFRRRKSVPVAPLVEERSENADVPALELGETSFNGNGHSWARVEPAWEIVTDPIAETAAPDETSAEADEDEPEDEIAAPVEYRRRGLFRRRRPVLVAPDVDDESEQADDHELELELGEISFNGNGHSWARVEPTWEFAGEHGALEETESEIETETETEKIEEGGRRFFRRRRPELTASAVEEQPEETEVSEPEPEPAFETGPAETEFGGNGHSWADVDAVIDSEDEVAAESIEFDETETEKVEKGRRGFFRRRKPEIADDGITVEIEEAEIEEAEVEPAHEDEPEDELAASVEVAKPKRRLFRRHKPEPEREADLEDAESDEADPDAADGAIRVGLESVEDDAFENVPYYATEISYPPEDEYTPGESRQFEDELVHSMPADGAEVFAMSETEERGETPAEPSQEPGDDTSLSSEDHAGTEEPTPAIETDTEPAASPADAESFEAEPFETEPFEAQPSDTGSFEDAELEAPVQVAESEPEPELTPEVEPEPEFEPELQLEPDIADEVTAFEHEHEPVPLPKRNGSGSARGRKVVGLKVGASQIAAAVVAGNADRPALVGIARRPLEPGVVVDGELRDPEALARALKTFFKDHGLPAKNVRLGLSSSRVGVRTFDVAGIEDEARFDNAVRFKAHEVLPVAAHESVLDYRVVEERYMENGEISRRVLLVVAPRDQVAPYIEACHAAGLRLAGVDLEAFGLLRAFVPPLGVRSRSEDSATVVVAIGHEASTLLVAGGGICEFTRVFDWGGGALQAAIADELDVPLMEATTILTHLSLSGPGRHLDSLDSDTRSRALEAVRTRLMPFARELVSSLQFYQTQPESLGIREILITGGTSHLEGLADALHQMIGVNVSVGDPLGRVDVQTEIPAALDATIGSLAVPIGLAIEDDAARSVNLLPKDARQGRKRPNVLAIGAPLAAAVPLAALAFLFLQASGIAGDRQAELGTVRAQIEALPEPTRPNIDPALAGEQAVRATAVAQILGGRLSWERVLGDISRVLPQGVSLTELAATAPQPTAPEVAAPTTADTSSTTPSTPAPTPVAAPTTPTGVTVTGYALDYATIARALARIQAVPSLANAQLQSATPGTIGQKRTIEFTIVADLAIPGGAQ